MTPEQKAQKVAELIDFLRKRINAPNWGSFCSSIVSLMTIFDSTISTYDRYDICRMALESLGCHVIQPDDPDEIVYLNHEFQLKLLDIQGIMVSKY